MEYDSIQNCCSQSFYLLSLFARTSSVFSHFSYFFFLLLPFLFFSPICFFGQSEEKVKHYLLVVCSMMNDGVHVRNGSVAKNLHYYLRNFVKKYEIVTKTLFKNCFKNCKIFFYDNNINKTLKCS